MGNFYNLKKNNAVIIFNNNYGGEFWNYCGIYIPNYISHVPCIDGINELYSDGSQTELDSDCIGYTINEYIEKFAIKGIDGKLYWKE